MAKHCEAERGEEEGGIVEVWANHSLNGFEGDDGCF